ncbi:BspA family leucine-rich repeat surface protein [Enterococcus rotai]|uniref:BspA family leucine-rich repeat surface protein n=1 Tax=Enterococcus rotai TaxID=118060 RepID=UPI0032B3CFB2
MSKKKLTKKRKKQLLTLFTMTSMTVNLVAAPLASLAEGTSEAGTVESSLTDTYEVEQSGVEASAESTTDSTMVEEEAESVKEKSETEESQTRANRADSELLTGSYENGGTWTFDQESGKLVLTGGTLSKTIGNDTWIKKVHRDKILAIEVVDATGAEDLSSLFSAYRNAKKISFDNFDTSQVTDMMYLFSGCGNLTELDVSGLDTSRVTNMARMFDSCSRLTELDVSGLDTSRVTNMSGMFFGCGRLTELDVSGLNTSQVINMDSMFNNCSALVELDLSSFDTSQVTNMSGMFWSNPMGKTVLTKVDVSSFDTSQVTDMSRMFANNEKLTELDLSNFDTSKVTTMNGMFSQSTALEKLILGSETKLATDTSLKELSNVEFWQGELENNFIETSGDLCTYHNELAKTNTYTLINRGEELITLSFDTVGGSEVAAIETNFGSVWIEPTAPTKVGHSFMGWYTDEEYTAEFDFATPATESTTIYAKWAEDKEEVVFETDDYYIGDYNITGRFNAPIVTAQLRIDGEISNRGGTFNQTDGTFYYYAGAGRIQTGQDVVLEGLDSAGNIVETVKIEPKVVAGSLDNVQYTVGTSTITGEYTGNMSKARLVVNGTIISVGGTFKDGVFSYYVNPSQLKETDTIQMQGYDAEGNPVGDLTPVSVQKQSGQLLEANYIMGQTTITGKYEGNVKKGRLFVDGKQISVGGTFKDGIFSYYVAPGTIKADSVVELAAYGDGDVLLTEENFVVNIQE